MSQHVFVEMKSHQITRKIPRFVGVQFEFSIGLRPVNNLITNLEQLQQKRISDTHSQLIHIHIHNARRNKVDKTLPLL
jgi:hypothetical protein